MDYLDTRKQFQHKLILLIGYVFVTVAIVIGALVLLYQAYGFGFGKNGTVIQNGLVFLSSQPNPAKIYLNGVANTAATNARVLLPAGIYQVTLARQGYRSWQRTIGVDGGAVEHFDYPVLFPAKLTTTKVQTYSSPPDMTTQSPDRRWMLVKQPGSASNFDLYDLKNPKTVETAITLPGSLLTKATRSESWQLGQWADDNQHVLLEHIYDGKTEFILLDTQNPDQSVNLNTTFHESPTQITLNNKKYDQYYIYDASSGSLETTSLKSPTVIPLLNHVLAYQSYGSNSVLYATDSNAPADKVLVKLMIGNQTYVIHTFPDGGNYLLDLTGYGGTLYVTAGDSTENKVYIYKDPVGQLNANPAHAVAPIQVLHVDDPTYLSFSDNAQFIMAENGTRFGVYDIENKNGYNYTSPLPLDAPQQHASWMDGNRLTYISGAKLAVFDYDDANRQTLEPLLAGYVPFFSSNYHYVYGLAAANTAGQVNLTQTPLLTPADQ